MIEESLFKIANNLIEDIKRTALELAILSVTDKVEVDNLNTKEWHWDDLDRRLRNFLHSCVKQY